MRLYLSSYLWGNHPEKILELIGSNPKKAAIITNSADQFPEVGIIERLKQDQDFLLSLGITSERLDLRDYFGDRQQELATKLKQYGFIWVRGANVFVLRRAMRKSGFDEIITNMLKNDEVLYGGFSAGACVIGTTLRGLELVDDANVIPTGYDPEILWDGLSMLPFAIAPHYKSDHPESPLIDKTIDYYIQNNLPFKALRDGEVLIVDGDSETVLA